MSKFCVGISIKLNARGFTEQEDDQGNQTSSDKAHPAEINPIIRMLSESGSGAIAYWVSFMHNWDQNKDLSGVIYVAVIGMFSD